jgi:hypothetical protein
VLVCDDCGAECSELGRLDYRTEPAVTNVVALPPLDLSLRDAAA